jgi:multiple sugar transport system ATP-binding protein
LSLEVHDREFIVLVGPSGCGKTTILRMIAGLEDVTAGHVRIGGRRVNDVAPKDRNVAMVFQDYALYPHMSAYKNMAFGLMLRRQHTAWENPLAWIVSPTRRRAVRTERQSIDQRVRRAADMLGIQRFLHRRPAALSGGERQRVALGRAIVREPDVFLFDEPLSNLDARLRLEMRAELKQLHRRVQITSVYVTHDQEEAMTLGGRVGVMKDGVMQQCDTPFAIYDYPVNRFVAGFMGTPSMNFVSGRIVRTGERLVFDEGHFQLMLCEEHQERMRPYAGRPTTIGIRPDALSPAAESDAGSSLRVQVAVVEPLGDRIDLFVTTPGNHSLVCRVDSPCSERAGSSLTMKVDMKRVHFFATDGQQRSVSLPAN